MVRAWEETWGSEVVIQWSALSVKYSFSELLIQWCTNQWSIHSVKSSFSEVLLRWSPRSVKYSFSEVLLQWSTHSVKYSFSEILIQWSIWTVMVFLRANHAGAAVLHMPLSNNGISFNITLWIMNHGTKCFFFSY